jgi:dihydrolipoamide dehydrogenase
LPKSIAIIGGGYIGSEIASILNAFGVEVSIIELLPGILANVDEEVASVVHDEFIKRGIKIYTGLGVNKIKNESKGYKIVLSDGNLVEAEKILMAVGRKPEDSTFNKLGLSLNAKGYIEVNDRMETNIKNIFAIGDITGKIQLAHVASAQGIAAVENVFAKGYAIDYDVVPSCIFTNPEIAYVGMTEKQVKEKKIPYKVFKFPFFASGKALALGDTRGFVKIIADSRWDEILGVHIVGPDASNLITEAAVAMKMEATVDELAHTIHPHPTLTEAVMEAAEGIMGKAIHI